jgi:hypothetical protein
MGRGGVTWLFGGGKIDPSEVEMNLRRGQLVAYISKIQRQQRRQRGNTHARDTKREPHIVVRGQLLAVPRKRTQDLHVLRRAPHRSRYHISARKHTAAPLGCPSAATCEVRAEAERTDVSCAVGACGEHVERVDALGGTAECDERVESWCERVCNLR